MLIASIVNALLIRVIVIIVN